MSEICELEDLSKDCCVNCFNGLPAYGCPKQEEESNQLRELIHKKAIKKEQRIRSDERIKVIEEFSNAIIKSIKEQHVLSVGELKKIAEQLKNVK